MKTIYLSPPDVGETERRMLLEAFDSGWIAPVGPDIERFEAETAAVCGRRFAVALSSGTAALHLGLRELGVGPGDLVLCSTLTFAATANAIRYCDAVPVFVDADPSTWQISPELVERALETYAGQIRAAIVVDLYGQCADFISLAPLLESHNVRLLEDAAEALGAQYADSPAGNFGEASVLSFNGNKIITTGGGGMLMTDSATLAERVRFLSTQAREPTPHYEHREIGFNYRLSNLLAALGRGQLRSLRAKVERRREIFEIYRKHLSDAPGVSFMPEDPNGRSNRWLTCIMVDPDVAGVTREDVRLHLESRFIESRPTWKPMHLQPIFQGSPAFLDGTSDTIFSNGLCLPSGSGMTDEEVAQVIDALREALSLPAI